MSLHQPGIELRANLKSIFHRCHLFEVAFVWELTSETIHLPLGCLQVGYRVHLPLPALPRWPPLHLQRDLPQRCETQQVTSPFTSERLHTTGHERQQATRPFTSGRRETTGYEPFHLHQLLSRSSTRCGKVPPFLSLKMYIELF